jgi:undecaprenyl-phosphate galactose phosphotransferase
MRYGAKLCMIKLGIWVKNVYIIGTGQNAYETFRLLGANSKNNIMGYCVKGLIDPDHEPVVSNHSNIDSNKLELHANDERRRLLVVGQERCHEPVISNHSSIHDDILNLPVYGYEFLLNNSSQKQNIDSNLNPDSSTNVNLNISSDAEIVCALPTEDLLKNMRRINILQTKYAFVSIVPDIKGLPLYGVELDHFFGSDQLFLRLQNNLGRRTNRIIKRAIDIVLALFGLILLLPVFVIFAIVIKLSTHGPVFFKHGRIGSNGSSFGCIKFQTMYPNSQELLVNYLATNVAAKLEWEQSFKLKNDPRVTFIGKFLRKTSLDELPQLWNVLIGEMSLVGPRPIIEAEIPRYHEDFYYYKLVRPGVTGLWQVSGRSDVDYAERVRFDIWYVKNWSLWYDFVILIKTIGVVFGGRGAY